MISPRQPPPRLLPSDQLAASSDYCTRTRARTRARTRVVLSVVVNINILVGFSYILLKWDAGMATPRHTPQGRGYDSSLAYFHHCVDYWTLTPSIGCPVPSADTEPTQQQHEVEMVSWLGGWVGTCSWNCLTRAQKFD